MQGATKLIGQNLKLSLNKFYTDGIKDNAIKFKMFMFLLLSLRSCYTSLNSQSTHFVKSFSRLLF